MNSEERWDDLSHGPGGCGGADEHSDEFVVGDFACRGDKCVAVLDPETWMDCWSDELLNLWGSLREQCEANGYAILDVASFPDFAQWCFEHSSGRPPVA